MPLDAQLLGPAPCGTMRLSLTFDEAAWTRRHELSPVSPALHIRVGRIKSADMCSNYMVIHRYARSPGKLLTHLDMEIDEANGTAVLGPCAGAWPLKQCTVKQALLQITTAVQNHFISWLAADGQCMWYSSGQRTAPTKSCK